MASQETQPRVFLFDQYLDLLKALTTDLHFTSLEKSPCGQNICKSLKDNRPSDLVTFPMRLLIDDACKKGNVDQPINLTKQGYKPNDPCEEGFTPFIYITFAAQVDACDALITSQADINVQNGYD